MFSILKNGTRVFSHLMDGSKKVDEELCHFVNGRSLKGPFDVKFKRIVVGMGCFWGVEKLFWDIPGIYITSVGYLGGDTKLPTYQQVCSGKTGHNEVVNIYYEPEMISLPAILKIFWEGHDPTQGMRQGNDIGTQYRSGIYIFDNDDLKLAIKSRDIYQEKLDRGGLGLITTEILQAKEFFYAEDYHQQYLAKNPSGYCGLGGTGIKFGDFNEVTI
jgi:peptide-methionine (S)-S-oxide reductase